MDENEIRRLAQAILLRAMKAACKPIAFTTDDGVSVSTVLTPDKGPETAICDISGNHPVERYATESAAREGHQRWVQRLFGGLREVTRMAYGLDGTDQVPERRIKLLRDSDFAGPRDIDPDSVVVELWPFSLRGSRVRIDGEIVADAGQDPDMVSDYIQGYLKMLSRLVIGMEPARAAEPEPIRAGDTFQINEDGTVSKGTPGRAPDIFACKRLSDVGTQPEGSELDTCFGCSAMVVYDPKGPTLPRVCWQCVRQAQATGQSPLEK